MFIKVLKLAVVMDWLVVIRKAAYFQSPFSKSYLEEIPVMRPWPCANMRFNWASCHSRVMVCGISPYTEEKRYTIEK